MDDTPTLTEMVTGWAFKLPYASAGGYSTQGQALKAAEAEIAFTRFEDVPPIAERLAQLGL